MVFKCVCLYIQGGLLSARGGFYCTVLRLSYALGQPVFSAISPNIVSQRYDSAVFTRQNTATVLGLLNDILAIVVIISYVLLMPS